ncbi:hypothetical protein F511_30755 [Dorcoceras hygrometricum]|uniref:WIT1/2 N-terminal helical bundle domain-containing protein n=1 Tax=Dorcoceras hygrometricum TaxID=472368 RepID=A0A2Z7BH99_9LAMI|nr:hypothetical protein F511_30755 [Dorcoceras hygrometricum]
MTPAQMEDSAHEVQDPLGRKFGESRQPKALKFQIPPPENPRWWKVFDADKSGIEEACGGLAQLYSLPKAQYIPMRKEGELDSFMLDLLTDFVTSGKFISSFKQLGGGFKEMTERLQDCGESLERSFEQMKN